MRSYIEARKPTLFVSLHYFNFPEPEKNIQAIMDVLDSYPHLYLRDGSPADRDAIRRGVGHASHTDVNADLLATERAWTAD